MTSRELYEMLNELRAEASKGAADIGINNPERSPVDAFRESIERGSGDTWLVWLPDHPATMLGENGRDRPAHAVTVCWTGNGPRSEANARFIAAVFHHQRDLFDLVEAGVRAHEYARSVINTPDHA
jgi:hypothetical protein